ncbi:MAG: DUF1428 domain-containing protein [Pyrinomonadaceae bacterium]
MGKYVDGFVLPIAKENVEKYTEMARKAGEIWMEHGALEYYEAVGDDLEIEKMLSFKKIADASENETVIFAWIVYESREHRDKVNEAVMSDPRLKEDMEASKNLFDFKRMAYGGFKTLVTF